MKKFASLVLLMVLALTALAPGAVLAQEADIVDTAVAAGNFTTLAAALGAAGLVDTLKGEGPFTVFAPTDDAFAALFAALGEETVNALLGDIPALTNILTFHVASGKLMAADVVGRSSLQMLNGDFAKIDGATINGASIVATDIEASNGVIHVIDAVILPPADDIVDTAVAAGSFTTLAAFLEAADLIGALKGEGPFTVFAPTDDAFAALGEETINGLYSDIPALTNILTYHVVSGALPAADVVSRSSLTMLNGAPALIDGAKINDANIIATDIFTRNGVIHVIDAVILPPSSNIVETAVSAGNFETLVAAVQAAGLADALSGSGPLTVFAPTDDAFAALFAALGEEAVNALLADIPALTNILTYHVASGLYPAADVLSASQLRMLNGAPALIDGAKINDANIVATNILTSNGVIHVIDAVILPPSGDIVDTAVAAGGFNTLAAALQAADLVGTLKGEGPFTVFAPTDEAFAALDEETRNAVFADPTLLTSILLYHVVPGAVPAAEVVSRGALPTAMGESLSVSVDGGVRVNGANVIQANILASNGIIHVIDAVLVPQSPTAEAGEACAAVVNTGANLRAGPSTEFGRIAGAAQGTAVQVIARNADGSWYELALADSGRAWIAGFLLSDLTCPDGFTLPVR